MKKILTVLFTLLILVGCSSSKGYSKLSNGTDVIYTSKNGDFTKNDLYKSLKLSSEAAVETDLIYKIAELEQIDTTTIEKETEELISMYQQMNAEYYLIAQYGSIDAFRKSYNADGIVKELAKAYINTKFDEYVQEDKPVKMQVAFFDTEEAASKVIDDVNNGSTFDMAIANNGYEFESANQVYLDTSSTLDLYVKQYLNETTNTGLSSVITSVATTTDANGNYENKNNYYVLNIESRDVNDFKDEYLTQKTEAVDKTEVKSYFFEKHNIEFYDQDIYEMMKEKYEVLQ